MKISTNYTHFIHKSRKLITTPVANTPKLLQMSEKASDIQKKSRFSFLKKTYNSIKNFIFKQEVYDEIPPLPIKNKTFKKRTKIQFDFPELSEDRKKLKTDYKNLYSNPIDEAEEQKLNILLTKKNKNGEYIFNNVYSMRDYTNKKDLSPTTLDDLLNFCINNPKSFSTLLPIINDVNIEVYKSLLIKKFSNKSNDYTIDSSYILSLTKKDNKNEVLALINAKDDEGNYRFDNSSIGFIARNINKNNNRAVPYLLNAKKSNGVFKFSNVSIWQILSFINDNNIAAVPYLLEHKSKIKNKIKHTLDAHEFYNIMKEINKENIKTVPLLMQELRRKKEKGKGFLTAEQIGQILKNIKNGDEKFVPEILKIKHPVYKSYFLFNTPSECEYIGEVAKTFADKSLKSIAKKLLTSKPFTIFLDTYYYTSANGIYEYSKMIRDNTYTKERKFLSKFHNYERIPRFKNMKEIATLAKDLANAPNKEILKELITLKDPYSKDFVYSNFSQYDDIKNLDNNTNIENIKELLNVTNHENTQSVLTLKTIIQILNKYKNYKVEEMPIPKILPENNGGSTTLFNNLELIDEYRKGHMIFEKLTTSQKLNLKNYLNTLSQYPLKENHNYKFNLKNFKEELNKYISQTIIPTETNKIDRINLFKNVLNNNENIENQIKSFDFTNFGKNGLPLSFSRMEFLNRLKNFLEPTTNTVRKHILQKLQIQPNEDFTGYEGIINLLNLNKSNKLEKQIFELCHNFIYENKVTTNNKEFDKFANSLIKGMPEFINIIGKQPHGAHNYSIDIHILEVLKNCINHKDYKTLNNTEKTKLKMAALMHDIAKKEKTTDKEHQGISALYARNILSKYNLPQFIKNDIYFLVQNHHWLEELSCGKKTTEELACNFRNPQDVTLSKIFTHADLKSVSPIFFEQLAKNIEGEKAKNLYNLIDTLKENGNILFTSKIINPQKLPIEEYKNQNYQVINLTKITKNKDLGTIGFVPGTKINDLRFLIHTVKNAEALHIVKDLNDVSQDGILSLSYISPKQKGSYQNNKFGVILDANIPDIINATPHNQGSGCEKSKEKLISLKTNKFHKSSKEFLPKIIRKNLGINNNEYKSLYNQIANKKHFSQIQDTDIFKLSANNSFNGEKIKKAIIQSEEELLKCSLYGHNEVVGSYLKTVGFFAKVNNIKNIPKEYLVYIKEHNIPIFLFGE